MLSNNFTESWRRRLSKNLSECKKTHEVETHQLQSDDETTVAIIRNLIRGRKVKR